MKRREYFRECSRLSGVVADKNEAFANFVSDHPDLTEEDFEEFDAHQAELSIAMGEWQRFCQENRGNLTD
ncbi:hypothetical protein C3E97_020415 [Pseudomonas sp. MWU12-2115]|uniref:hypothetical protein n=1 Tax=unclassified Pseudomonas TaxID=196821 RepID=UPI000CD5303C|nr:hypothetical protein [Pseudomonas sp. MWU12-2020]RBB99637.1 hypothetical protein C3E97_020415 [Pseudomonas sp. MWU12-2115]